MESPLGPISSPRCRIRPFTEADLSAFMAYHNDLAWMRYQGFKGLSRQAYAKALLGDYSLADGIQLAVIREADQSLIGDLYARQDGRECWIGYTISPGSSRQGYAYEAVTVLLEALKRQGITAVKADIDPDNQASERLLIKLGFTKSAARQSSLIYRKEI